MAPVSTQAILLRAHAYGETSRILRFYTLDHGLVGVVARGVRGRSGKGGLTLTTFATGRLTAFMRPRADLHTMQDFACSDARARLGSNVLRFAGASALGELVLNHTEQESHPDVYGALESGLDDLNSVAPELVPGACLSGCWRVVEALGYAPELDTCVRCARALGPDEGGRFDLAAGGMLCAACAETAAGPRVGPIARGQIRAMLQSDQAIPIDYPRRHLALLSDFIAFHVAQKPLKSFTFLGPLLPAEPES